jgi:AcrR family transcriptional regulator
VRTQRSIAALSAALLELIESKPFDQITIKDITDTAGVSYPTFFRRYVRKEELLEDLATEEVRRLLDLAHKALDATSPTGSSMALCQHVQAHRKLWTTLLTAGASSAMRQEFMRVAKEMAIHRPRPNPWLSLDLSVPFVTSGIFEILAWWLRQPEDYPLENVVTMIDVLIIQPTARPQNIKLL